MVRLENLENFQFIYIAINEEVCFSESIKGVAAQPFDKETTVGVNCEFKKSPQKKPETKIRLY